MVVKDPVWRVVATDANIAINFAHMGRLGLLGQLPGFRFVMPEEAVAEVLDPVQAAMLQTVIADGTLEVVRIDDVGTLTLFAELTASMGRGEAACLSLAVTQGWLVASDERRVFRREALARLGPGRLLNTPGLLVLAIRVGLLRVEEADRVKALLEQRHFRMTFASFRDLLGDDSDEK